MRSARYSLVKLMRIILDIAEWLEGLKRGSRSYTYMLADMKLVHLDIQQSMVEFLMKATIS